MGDCYALFAKRYQVLATADELSVPVPRLARSDDRLARDLVPGDAVSTRVQTDLGALSKPMVDQGRHQVVLGRPGVLSACVQVEVIIELVIQTGPDKRLNRPPIPRVVGLGSPNPAAVLAAHAGVQHVLVQRPIPVHPGASIAGVHHQRLAHRCPVPTIC